MTPLRRTALVSVFAAAVLIAIKLAVGLASGSLGFVAEALHSGTDLVAALLTFFAVGYAAKPPDASHPYGHGKAEHLTALAEAAFLVLVSVLVAGLAVARLAGRQEGEVDAHWWAFVAAGVVIAIDLSRTAVSWRAARQHRSAALRANALHFGADFAGTTAVLIGLVFTRAGWPAGDSIAALFVAGLVVFAGVQLIRSNISVLMDRAPANAVTIARDAIDALEPPVELRRLRLREGGGRLFADVVIGVSPGAAVGQGHAAAGRVEDALELALPGIDVVVHVEPVSDERAALREQVRAAAMSVSHVRELHDLALIETGEGIDVVVHVKLPSELPLVEAHARAEAVERAIAEAVPSVRAVQTHLEPLIDEAQGHETDVDEEAIAAIAREVTGADPREVRVLSTPAGLVMLLTVTLAADTSLQLAHERAGEIAHRVRKAHPEIADVVVHTEP